MSRSKRKGRCGRGCGACGHAGESRAVRQAAWDKADLGAVLKDPIIKSSSGWDIVSRPHRRRW